MRLQKRLGRRFWHLLSATAISSAGDGVFDVALPLLALSYTRSPLAISGVVVATYVPALFVALPVGTLADRLDRRRLMLSLEATRFLILVVFTAILILHRGSLAAIYAAAFALGASSMAFDVASGAVLPTIVGEDNLVRANAHLLNAETTSENLVGQAIGGAALAAGRAVPFAADAASFVVSALLLRRAVPPNPPSQGESSVWQDLRSGLGWFIRTPSLRMLALLIASFAFCQSMVFGVLVLYGRKVLHLSPGGYGLMMALSSVGLIVGASLAPRLNAWLGTGWTLSAVGVVAAGAYALLASAGSAPMAVLALFIETASVIIGSSAYRSVRQRLTPPELQGRIASVFLCLTLSCPPAGALVGGLVGGAGGLKSTFLVAGALQLVVVAGIGPSLIRALRDGGPRPQIAVRARIVAMLSDASDDSDLGASSRAAAMPGPQDVRPAERALGL